jgi:hypothetical protein
LGDQAGEVVEHDASQELRDLGRRNVTVIDTRR